MTEPQQPDPRQPEPRQPEPPAPEPPAPRLAPAQVVRTAWAFYLLLGLAGVVWVGLRETVIPLALFVNPRRWWLDLGAGLAAGGALLAVWHLAVRRLAAARELEQRLGGVIGALSGEEALALAVLSGVAEELFFRGAVQGSWGFVWATLLFALLHSGPGRVFGLWTAFAAVAGALFGGLMLWSGNLLAPVVAHAVVNAVNLRRLGAEAAARQGGGAPLRPE
jgi:membrane protease YdiL (CAAX protease family)